MSVPQAADSGFTLASAIQAATGRDTTYSVMTNSITHTLAANAPWLSDADLATRAGAYPSGASSSDPRSLNAILGEGTISGSTVTWAFVRMAPWTVLYLRSNRLRCENHHGPRPACTTIWLAALLVAQWIFGSPTGRGAR